jgi:predicted transcriptional regulator of viral defense system
MNITKKIEEKLKTIKEGETFTYKELLIKKEDYQSAAKSIERLIKKGTIKRISPGLFFKPKQTVFGELLPKEEEILKPYLYKNGSRIAYITGIYLYNKLGLSTQIPQTIKIASRNKEIKVNKSNLKIKPAKSYVDVTSKNYQYLEILDAIKDFKKIPDLGTENGIKILLNILKELNQEESKKIIKYSLEYPPRTRALLGALLEETGIKNEIDDLQESLNPLSEYSLGINKEILSTAENWKIR